MAVKKDEVPFSFTMGGIEWHPDGFTPTRVKMMGTFLPAAQVTRLTPEETASERMSHAMRLASARAFLATTRTTRGRRSRGLRATRWERGVDIDKLLRRGPSTARPVAWRLLSGPIGIGERRDEPFYDTFVPRRGRVPARMRRRR